MEFDKSRVYTAFNAEDLKVGSKCIFADTASYLRQMVQDENAYAYVQVFTELWNADSIARFKACDYRYLYAYLIEPPAEPKYMPFESVEKAMDATKKHGGWVKDKKNNVRLLVVGFEEDDVFVLGNGYCCSYINLFLDYVFADDGSPCGELVEA